MTDGGGWPRYWSVLSAMIATAAAALLCAAIRGGDGRGTVGAVIVGCTLLLALALYRDAASRKGLEDPASWRRKALDALFSLGGATLIVGLSDLAFVVGFLAWSGSRSFEFRSLVVTGRCWVGPEPPTLEACTAAGLVLGLAVARSLRLVLSSLVMTGRPRRGDYLRLWPVALTLALLALWRL
ncbi:hypothetical protein [Paludisphaera rhizosphaerae]|uniref:hypothetical protein n=1 Tax=Paludisphaera rhizosphaerae TaxID=2711216 RepID=UPI0013EA758F|nr:hypothetical protein [Paludisphaera rhizosphaerae]